MGLNNEIRARFLLIICLSKFAAAATDAADIAALQAISAAIPGLNWPSPASYDPCLTPWLYLTCDQIPPGSGNWRVTRISVCTLPNAAPLSGITGTIPAEFGNLTQLVRLQLCNLGLTGTFFLHSPESSLLCQPMVHHPTLSFRHSTG